MAAGSVNCGEYFAGGTVDDEGKEIFVKEDVAPTEVVRLSILISLTDYGRDSQSL